jgi:LmbE family N-acetylglucosaminyl deacetylase
VVVSPHLDDGVLSLGAAMASWVRLGARVELLTVFGCDPESTAPSGGWDRRAGFRTEGEAARGRRAEDARACEELGVAPVWLAFGALDYDRHGDDEAVHDGIVNRLAGVDVVLVPGHPLTHPDHAWLAEELGAVALDARVGWYAEQPYAHRAGPTPDTFDSVDTALRDRLAKWRAVRRYRSQLPLLAMSKSLTRGPHVLAFASEAISWR